jgi:hypothetical protein
MRRRRPGAARDQSDSPFSGILTRLCDDSGALAAALVDAEGETVDYAGVLEPYDIKVMAAEWRIVLAVVEESPSPLFQGISGISVRARGRSYLIEAMPDGYAIALRLPRHSFNVSRRALSQAVRELGSEAGIELPEARTQVHWARVHVRTPNAEDKLRPDAIWLSDRWSPVTILGRYQARDLLRSERGYLARLVTGAEVFLVREPLGIWFIDNAAALHV